MKKVEKNWLEWTVFAVGLLLVASTLAYLTYAGVTMGHEPPNLEVRVGTPEQRQSNFVVPVSVVNHGDQTAEGVQVEVVLEINGSANRRGEFNVPLLPRHGSRDGWVTFDQDPRTGRLSARVLGFQKH